MSVLSNAVTMMLVRMRSVYANGKELEPARRITLTHAMMRNWETILNMVTDRVNLNSGAARK